MADPGEIVWTFNRPGFGFFYSSLGIVLLAYVARFLALAWFPGELWLVVIAQLMHAATFGAFHSSLPGRAL